MSEKTKKKVVLYDPSVKAYREYSEEEAKKFLDSAEKVKKALSKEEKNDE